MNLHLNMRVDAIASLLTRQDWQGCFDGDCDLIDGEDIYLGLDLSGKIDLTALVGISANDGDRIKPWFWKPKDLMAEHEKRDRAPYDKWMKEGHLIAVPGKSIDVGHVAILLGEIKERYNIVGLAYDRWRMEYLIKDLNDNDIECYKDGDGHHGIRLVEWGQGYKDMAPSIDALEESIITGDFKHAGNPVLTWNFSNAVAVSDPSGNRKLDKQKARFRIDGAVATVMARGLKARDMMESPLPLDDFLNDPITLRAG